MSNTIKTTVNTMKIRLHDLHPPLADIRAEVLAGLGKPQKAISPKFLYDHQGAHLFDAICTLDEYYLTRTEMAILRANAREIVNLIGDGWLIEFGSGSCQKIRILLDAMDQSPTSQLPTYVALDISKQQLLDSCANLVAAYPGLEAIAVCADYTQPLELDALGNPHHKVAFFPGSSIGNLEPDEVIQFLKNTATIVQPSGGLIVGVDLKKSKEIIEPAYDDVQGISAAFALNLLTRINSELKANFNLEQFRYRAFYNPIGRVEMYLVSLCNQMVQVDGVAIPFQQGEPLLTEYSYKYSIPEFQSIALEAGFHAKCVWTDPEHLFSVHYLHLP